MMEMSFCTVIIALGEGGSPIPTWGKFPVNLMKLKNKGKGKLSLRGSFLRAHWGSPVLHHPSPRAKLYPFWEELYGRVPGVWQTPDQVYTRSGGEERVAVFSPPLVLDLLEALCGDHLLVCKLTKAT